VWVCWHVWVNLCHLLALLGSPAHPQLHTHPHPGILGPYPELKLEPEQISISFNVSIGFITTSLRLAFTFLPLCMCVCICVWNHLSLVLFSSCQNSAWMHNKRVLYGIQIQRGGGHTCIYILCYIMLSAGY